MKTPLWGCCNVLDMMHKNMEERGPQWNRHMTTDCKTKSNWSITSSLSSASSSDPSSSCAYTCTSLSSVTTGAINVCWCELEHVDLCWCWSSLGLSEPSLWCLETTPNSGMLVTMTVWFLWNWEHRVSTKFSLENILNLTGLTKFGFFTCLLWDIQSWTGLTCSSLTGLPWSLVHSVKEIDIYFLISDTFLSGPLHRNII